MNEFLNHEEIRREMDNYINHAKANGFKINGYGNMQSYCHLLHEIIVIECQKKEYELKENDFNNTENDGDV